MAGRGSTGASRTLGGLTPRPGEPQVPPRSLIPTEAIRAVDGKAHEDNICVRVREWPQPVVVLLSRRVPQGQLHLGGERTRLTAGRWPGRSQQVYLPQL